MLLSAVTESPVAAAATARLTACADSHPFADRCIAVPCVAVVDCQSLTASALALAAGSVRIGRGASVSDNDDGGGGQLRPTKDNALFDCKVLSRCHAVLAYSRAQAAFLLADTRSSNGTFVNDRRLARGGRPCRLFTGDSLQLGVPVRCRDKPVFACVRARLELRHPDGTPATRRRRRPRRRWQRDGDSDGDEDVGHTELLARCLERAMQRERLLDLKLRCLRRRQLPPSHRCRRGQQQQQLATRWGKLLADTDAVARLRCLAAGVAEVDGDYDDGDGGGSGGDLAEISDAAADAWLAELDRGVAERQALIGRLSELEAQMDLGGRECQHLLDRCDQIAGVLSAGASASNVVALDVDADSAVDNRQRVGSAGAAVDPLSVGVQISLVEELLDYVLDKAAVSLDAAGVAARLGDDLDGVGQVEEADDADDDGGFDADDALTLRRVIGQHHRDARDDDNAAEDDDDDFCQEVEEEEEEDEMGDGADRRLSESLLATERRVAELVGQLEVAQRRYLASGADLTESARHLVEEMRGQARWLDESLGAPAPATATAATIPVGCDWRRQVPTLLTSELPALSILALLCSLTVYLFCCWL